MKYVKPIKLGDITLQNNIFYAPLAGCSDYPFRKMSSLYKPGLYFCEMVKMDALIRHDQNTYRLLDYDKDMHPIGAQLCGSKPNLAGPCAKILEDLGFDVIDLNCGCPVDKVTKDGSGSGLLKTPEKIGDILHEMKKATNVPITVKIRAGWDLDNINAKQITKIAEEAGASAITIHGRTRKQAYKGEANWEFIKECKDVAVDIKVIGNGDIFSGEKAKAIFDHTNCDGILIARGTMGSPWIIESIKHYLDEGLEKELSLELFRETLLKHMDYTLSYENEKRFILSMRRIGCWYLKKVNNAKKLRESLNKSKSSKEIIQIMNDFSFELGMLRQ